MIFMQSAAGSCRGVESDQAAICSNAIKIISQLQQEVLQHMFLD